LRLKIADAGIRTFERLVLDQRCLYQRIDCVGSSPQPIADGALRFRIALGPSDFREAIE
jgi:hypothetical protein